MLLLRFTGVVFASWASPCRHLETHLLDSSSRIFGSSAQSSVLASGSSVAKASELLDLRAWHKPVAFESEAW